MTIFETTALQISGISETSKIGKIQEHGKTDKTVKQARKQASKLKKRLELGAGWVA